MLNLRGSNITPEQIQKHYDLCSKSRCCPAFCVLYDIKVLRKASCDEILADSKLEAKGE